MPESCLETSLFTCKMKKLVLLFIFLTSVGFSQTTIEKTDGSKLSVTSVTINTNSEKITYFLPNDTQATTAGFREIKLVYGRDYIFKVFRIKKKFNGFYILSESKTKTLALVKDQRIANRGGFDLPYNHFSIVVFDKNEEVVDQLNFSDTNTGNNAKYRGKVPGLIKSNFSDCPALMHQINQFENQSDDPKNRKILDFFSDATKRISCE